MQEHQKKANPEQINSEYDLPIILKDRTFKMSEMLLSWKYVMTTDIGL